MQTITPIITLKSSNIEFDHYYPPLEEEPCIVINNTKIILDLSNITFITKYDDIESVLSTIIHKIEIDWNDIDEFKTYNYTFSNTFSNIIWLQSIESDMINLEKNNNSERNILLSFFDVLGNSYNLKVRIKLQSPSLQNIEFDADVKKVIYNGENSIIVMVGDTISHKNIPIISVLQ